MPPTASSISNVSARQALNPAFSRRTRLARIATAMAAASTLAVFASSAAAQETREEQKSAERADKASRLQPYAPSVLERRIQKLDGLLSSERPVYLAMGSSFEGAGLALGPGYRFRFGDTGAIDAKATVSIRSYRTAEAKMKLPSFAGDRVALDVHGSWIHAPRVAFFGVGPESVKAGRTDFEYRSKTVGVGGTVNLAEKIRLGAGLDALHTEGSAVGNALAVIQPTYRRTSVSAEFDSRTSPDYSRRGSLARIEWADYHQTNAGNHSFRRLDAEVQQMVPLMRENWVLAFRGLVSTTDASDGHEVPYFLMPSLGGSTMLRGYSHWRFRDQNRMLLTGEYRWMAGPLVDMAIFLDAGKVTARRADLNFKDLEFSQGIGVRFHTPKTTVTRIEFARSHEGKSLILSFSPSF